MLELGTLTLAWPQVLWLLALLPLLVALYARVVAARRRAAARYAALELAGGADRPPARHAALLPPLLLLAALAVWIVAVARPHAVVLLPARTETVVLAIDVSGSMRATDIKPDRIGAARQAAYAFLDAQPPAVRVGIVAVAGSAALVQSPTTNRDELRKAIERLQVQRGTALGSGLLIALATLAPGTGLDVQRIIDGAPPKSATLELARRQGTSAFEPVEPGSNAAVAIVLLSDGQSNTGPDPFAIAELAAERGVRIHTVGLGTPQGATLSTDGWSMRVRLDEAALRKISDVTRGDYYRAEDAAQLRDIYRELAVRFAFERKRQTEITALFAAAGAVLAMLSVILSMRWFNRVL